MDIDAQQPRVARKLEQPAVGGAHDQKWWLPHRLQADELDLEHSAEGRIHHPRRRQATGVQVLLGVRKGPAQVPSPGDIQVPVGVFIRECQRKSPGLIRASRDVGAKVHASRSWSYSVAGSAGVRQDSHHSAVP